MSIQVENDSSENESFDADMQPDTRSAAEIHSDELRERLQLERYAVEVIRHDASGKETEKFFSQSDWLATVSAETKRCTGHSNRYAEVTLYVPGERGIEQTDSFAKVGPSGVLGLPIPQRAGHSRRS